jgi:hypothetical protein
MTKKRPDQTGEYFDAISHLKAAPEKWPLGYKNSLIRHVLEKAKLKLTDELIEMLNQKRSKSMERNKSNLVVSRQQEKAISQH